MPEFFLETKSSMSVCESCVHAATSGKLTCANLSQPGLIPTSSKVDMHSLHWHDNSVCILFLFFYKVKGRSFCYSYLIRYCDKYCM